MYDPVPNFVDGREHENFVHRMDTTISRINQMLTSCSIPILLQDVKECIPSLWIALFESLFQTRLKGLKSGKEQEAVTFNLRLLLLKLETIGSVSLDYISVQKLMKKGTPKRSNYYRIYFGNSI